MDSIISQIFSLLTTQPGNLVFRVILAFSIFAALQITSRKWQDTTNRSARRMAGGLGVLLGIQFVLIIVAGLDWQNVLDGRRILPVLMCGASLMSLLWLAWLWIYPDTARRADFTLGGLSILIVFVTIIGSFWWIGQDGELFFSGTWVDQVAGLSGIGVCLVSVILLTLRQPVLWGFGFVSMVILLLGYLANWLFAGVDNDFAGIVRLAEMIVYPLLLILPQRLDVKSVQQETKASDGKIGGIAQHWTVAEQRLLQALISRAAETEPNTFYADFCRAYAQWLMADVCLLALPPNGSSQLSFCVGYDMVKDQLIDGFVIKLDRLPLLTSVVRRSRNLRLDANTSAIDLKSLAEALGFQHVGHLLAVAVSPKGGTPLMSIVVLSPYTKRAWSANDQQKMLESTTPIAGVLQLVRRISQQMEELERSRAVSGVDQRPHGEIGQGGEKITPTVEQALQQTGQNQARTSLPLIEQSGGSRNTQQLTSLV